MIMPQSEQEEQKEAQLNLFQNHVRGGQLQGEGLRGPGIRTGRSVDAQQ